MCVYPQRRRRRRPRRRRRRPAPIYALCFFSLPPPPMLLPSWIFPFPARSAIPLSSPASGPFCVQPHRVADTPRGSEERNDETGERKCCLVLLFFLQWRI